MLKIYHLVVFLGLALLSGCGEPVCVMGVGDCDWPGDPVATDSESKSTLVLEASKRKLFEGESLELEVTGGVAPMKFALYPRDFGMLRLNLFDKGRTATYTAPREIDRDRVLVEIRVKDDRGTETRDSIVEFFVYRR